MGIGFGRYIKHITVDCLGCLMYLYLKMEGEQGGEKNVEDTGAGLIRVHLGGGPAQAFGKNTLTFSWSLFLSLYLTLSQCPLLGGLV